MKIIETVDAERGERFELDDLDRNILQILLKDAGTPYTDVARELKVSGGTIHVRMKKMMDAGVVRGSRLIVDPPSLGFEVCAYLGIYLEKGSEYKKAVEELEKVPEVVEVHYTTGPYSMIAKIICRTPRHLKEVLTDRIQAITGVQRTETFISLDQNIHREIKLS